MTDHFESAGRRAWGQGVVVDGECVFQALPGDKIAELFSGIRDASDAKQMALLADAIAGGGLELRGIDDGARARIGEMFSAGP